MPAVVKKSTLFPFRGMAVLTHGLIENLNINGMSQFTISGFNLDPMTKKGAMKLYIPKLVVRYFL